MASPDATILILTPVKDAARYLATYIENLTRLTYPARLISPGILESDSIDGTFGEVEACLPELAARFRRVGLWKKDFGYRIRARPGGRPRCSSCGGVLEYGGPTFDRNAWRDHGRVTLDGLRQEGDLVRLDAEGLGIMAREMGLQCWGMPHLEIRNAR